MDTVSKVIAPAELTKRQELNNHIVSMRKYVQQARVHLIHKLTKEIKLLKERKGDEKVVQKFQRKSQRLLDEVFVLKELNKDEVSVYALQAKLTLTQVLQDLETPVKTRALARISHHRLVQAQVKKYRDTNPHWALQIPVLLEKSKEKQKTANKKLEKKEQLKAERSKQGKEKSEESVSLSPTNDSFEEDESDTVPAVKPTTKTVKKSKSSQPVTLDKVEGTLKVKVLTDLSELETEPEIKKRKLRTAINPSAVDGGVTGGNGGRTETPLQKRPRSSFFIGGVDEEITPAKEVKVQEPRAPKGQYSEPKPVFRKGKLISKPPNRAERRAGSKGGDHFRQKQFSKPDKNFGPPRNRFPAETNTQRVPPAPSTTEKLHPSWEAKKRQAQVLTSFQGKKKVFNNDD